MAMCHISFLDKRNTSSTLLGLLLKIQTSLATQILSLNKVLMNLEFLEKYVATTFPFDEKAADKYSAGKNVRIIITTDYTTGEPNY